MVKQDLHVIADWDKAYKFSKYRICVTVSALLTTYREIYGNNTCRTLSSQRLLIKALFD